MLAIPNTTTVPSETSAGFQAFPADAGALTPFANGFLTVANNSVQVSIRKGPTAGESGWTPYVPVIPTLVPITTDRGGRSRADYCWGVKFIDGVAGVHAQVSGALFQPGEAGFLPSTQIAGTVSPAGGFIPAVTLAPTIRIGMFANTMTITTSTLSTLLGDASSVNNAGLNIFSVALGNPSTVTINANNPGMYLISLHWQWNNSGSDVAGQAMRVDTGIVPTGIAVSPLTTTAFGESSWCFAALNGAAAAQLITPKVWQTSGVNQTLSEWDMEVVQLGTS